MGKLQLSKLGSTTHNHYTTQILRKFAPECALRMWSAPPSFSPSVVNMGQGRPLLPCYASLSLLCHALPPHLTDPSFLSFMEDHGGQAPSSCFSVAGSGLDAQYSCACSDHFLRYCRLTITIKLAVDLISNLITSQSRENITRSCKSLTPKNTHANLSLQDSVKRPSSPPLFSSIYQLLSIFCHIRSVSRHNQTVSWVEASFYFV